jgi:hypothetical protein
MVGKQPAAAVGQVLHQRPNHIFPGSSAVAAEPVHITDKVLHVRYK